VSVHGDIAHLRTRIHQRVEQSAIGYGETVGITGKRLRDAIREGLEE
jgi:hypothetical protein